MQFNYKNIAIQLQNKYNIEMKQKSEVLQIRLSTLAMAKVRRLAKKHKTSISEIGRLAVADYLASSSQVNIPLTVEEVARIFRNEMLKMDDENSTADV